MEMHGLDFVLFGSFILAYGLFSRRLQRTPITAPILAVAFGIAVGPMGFGWLSLDVRDGTMRLLAEFTLALVLFHDAARIDLRLLRKNLGTPQRLLGRGLPLTILLGAGAGYLLFPELSGWEIGLIAAMLAPTDAALGQAVVSNEAVPMRVRQALNVESGLNDGIVVPVVAVMMACAVGGEGGNAWTWSRHALEAVGYGAGVGIGVGVVAARLLDAAHRRGWMRDGSRHIGLAAVPVIAFFTAESVHGSGFLAAFIGGLALGSTTSDVDREGFEFTEDSGEVLGHATWLGFGAAAAPIALECASPATIAYALLSLTVVRMVPVALALRGTGFQRDTLAFIGWFGPRGLATVVFAADAFGEEAIPNRETVFGVAVWTILLSVLLHGTSAAALARRYGERCRLRDAGEGAPEELPVPVLPTARRRVPAP